jgi:hypothetical protein
LIKAVSAPASALRVCRRIEKREAATPAFNDFLFCRSSIRAAFAHDSVLIPVHFRATSPACGMIFRRQAAFARALGTASDASMRFGARLCTAHTHSCHIVRLGSTCRLRSKTSLA